MLPTRSDVQAPALRSVVSPILAKVCLDLQAEEASLWCISADGSHMELAVNHGGQSALLETLSVPVSDSAVGLVQATRMATAIGPEDDHHPAVDAATGKTTWAMVAAPILGPGGILGVVSAINPTHGGRFSGPDLTHLCLEANHLGEALLKAFHHGR